MKRILLTGFEPFLGESINPSQILLEQLGREFQSTGQVDTLLLPVSFARASELLQKKLDVATYSSILLMGQAGGRNKICLERVGLNWIETEKPDEDQVVPRQGLILEQEAPALFSDLPLTAWRDQLVAEGFPVAISLSAGGYVCNYVFYRTLLGLQKQGRPGAACFIHVPYLPEQTAGKPPDTPNMDLATMSAVLTSLIKMNL